MTQSLRGRVALVTGAGSLPGRGIGREVVQRLAERGARVLAVDIDGETAQGTADGMNAAGHEVVACQADVTNRHDIKRMVSSAIETFGRLDILINHAGFGSFMALEETDDAHWDQMIALNLTSVFLATREAMPFLLANETGGAIVNTISGAGLLGGRAGLGYTAAKHGVIGLTKNVAVTYASRNIRCNGVCPGYTRSPLPPGERPQIAHTDSSDEAGIVFGRVADLGYRQGEPGELANVIAFLSTDEASFVNGAIIPVDGGWTSI